MIKRPTTPHSKKVIQHYDNILEEKDTLFRNVETIAGMAETQMEILNRKYQASLSKPEALSAYLTKIVSLLNATNCLVFEFLETENPPFPVEPDNNHSCGSIRECYKQGPVNKGYSNIPNNETNIIARRILKNISATSDPALNLPAIENGRTSSPPTLCSNGTNLSTLSYTQGEDPLKVNGDSNLINLESPIGSSSKIIELEDELPKNDLPKKETIVLNQPSSNTGAIKRQPSTTNSYTQGCDKVSSWLNKTESNDIRSNIVEKMYQVKREEAKVTMPEIKFVPYVPPSVESDGSSSGKSRKKKSQLRKMNKDFEIPAMDVPAEGSTCVFSHIVSPQEFYLQIIHPTSSRNLDLIDESLNKVGQRNKAFVSKQEAQSTLGKYCSGYFAGKNNLSQWFRLQIIDWKLDTVNDEVIVQSIDYGFIMNISYKFLCELTLDLAKIPKLAIKCHFPCVYPIGSTPSNLLSDWPKSTIDVFYDMANLNKDPLENVAIEDVRLFEITFADSLGVDLIAVPRDGGDSIVSDLIDMGLAKEIIDSGDDPYLAEMIQDLDELDVADNANEYILGYDARDEARVCKFTRADGTCFKGRNCKLDHVQLKDGYTTDKCPTYCNTLRDIILPQISEEIQVFVTGYIDSCTYTVQMIRNPVNFENTNIIVDKDLADLVRNMNDPKIIGTYVAFKTLPAIGELILAYNPIAKKWMRTVVRGFEELDPVFIEVSPIDFGGDFRISIKNIRMMKEQFLHLPRQSFQIYLDNYQHKNTCDNKKANKFFEIHIFQKSFIARILTQGLPVKVKLMTLKGREIGHTLVREGFAEPRTVDNHLSEDTSVTRNLILD
ncbi:unnamed protein product [Ceutorhynchus assimilis]|uniref:C3H1-type domain-containing protein n=1 Tax=Ceutorhynchus assimilis TaxID=467358 RepID=A0A9N9QNW7_9CUCU|nr:unnamed protein product [Ceutorhynchus assimilis]